MKEFKVCGFGSAIVDLLAKVPDDFLERFECTKGGMTLVEQDSQQRVIEELEFFKPQVTSGGSVANSLVVLSQLGSKAAFLACVANDSLGRHFSAEFKDLNILGPQELQSDLATGSCLVMITDDAERTMRTCLGINGIISTEILDYSLVEKSEILFIEGYLIAAPRGPEAIREAVRRAKAVGTKIALTLSDAFIVQNFSQYIEELLPDLDFLFANKTELMSYFDGESFETARAMMAKRVPNVFITAGPDGAFYISKDREVHVEAYKCNPVDLTGAGDMFAGTILHAWGILEPELALKAACYLASKVISQVGARLAQNPVPLYKEIVK